MKTLGLALGTVPLLGAGDALGQSGSMMGGGMGGFGWMGGYGGIWVVLLVIVVAGVAAWILNQKGK